MDKDQSKPKDRWDKANIVVSLIITVGLGISSQIVSNSIKQTENGTQMVELALGILKEKPPANDTQARALRDWAINVLAEYSGVEVSDEARQAFRTIALPAPLPGEGGVDVSALPEEAVLFVDGVLQPKGLKFIPLSPGKHNLRIKLGDQMKELEVETRAAIAILPPDLF